MAYPETVKKRVRDQGRGSGDHRPQHVLPWSALAEYGEFNQAFLDATKAAIKAGKSVEDAVAGVQDAGQVQGLQHERREGQRHQDLRRAEEVARATAAPPRSLALVCLSAVVSGQGRPRHRPLEHRAVDGRGPGRSIEEITIAQVHAAMRAGRLTCHSLVQQYLRRIEAYDKRGPAINAIVVDQPGCVGRGRRSGPPLQGHRPGRASPLRPRDCQRQLRDDRPAER